jgi:hypothetical protein
MIEHVAYLALLGADQIGESAAESALAMAKSVGQSLAEGIVEEVRKAIAPRGGAFASMVSGAVLAEADKMAGRLGGSVGDKLVEALSARGAVLVSARELELYRNLERSVERCGDVQKELDELAAFRREARSG